jgi:hypothetical protein
MTLLDTSMNDTTWAPVMYHRLPSNHSLYFFSVSWLHQKLPRSSTLTPFEFIILSCFICSSLVLLDFLEMFLTHLFPSPSTVCLSYRSFLSPPLQTSDNLSPVSLLPVSFGFSLFYRDESHLQFHLYITFNLISLFPSARILQPHQLDFCRGLHTSWSLLSSMWLHSLRKYFSTPIPLQYIIVTSIITLAILEKIM